MGSRKPSFLPFFPSCLGEKNHILHSHQTSIYNVLSQTRRDLGHLGPWSNEHREAFFGLTPLSPSCHTLPHVSNNMTGTISLAIVVLILEIYCTTQLDREREEG